MNIKKKSVSVENALNTHQNDNTKLSQSQKIMQYMRDNGSITQIECTYCGMGTRLAARISDLRESGIRIATDMETDKHGSRYARYRLEEE